MRIDLLSVILAKLTDVHRHYFYVLRGEYIVPVTPRGGWFSRPVKHEDVNARGLNSPRTASGKKMKKRLIFSQSMIIDVDPREVRERLR